MEEERRADRPADGGEFVPEPHGLFVSGTREKGVAKGPEGETEAGEEKDLVEPLPRIRAQDEEPEIQIDGRDDDREEREDVYRG